MKSFQIRTTSDRSYNAPFFIKSESIEDIFHKIDGLRLDGKKWLKVEAVYAIRNYMNVVEAYVNIDHIVAIVEELEEEEIY